MKMSVFLHLAVRKKRLHQKRPEVRNSSSKKGSRSRYWQLPEDPEEDSAATVHCTSRVSDFLFPLPETTELLLLVRVSDNPYRSQKH
jgi:hypothetical protein